jgi:hypothetical protein
MGTRSLTTFGEKWTNKENNKTKSSKIVTVYRQYDGHPEGHGVELAEFLASGKMVNGISMGETERVFNGVNCMVAQFIKDFKDGAGGLYVYRGGAKDMWENYHYHVTWDHETNMLTMKCVDIGFGKTKNKVIFDGSPADFIKKCKKVEATT